jgi:hypothetical protein
MTSNSSSAPVLERGDEAQLVDDEEILDREDLLEPLQAAVVDSLDEFVHDGSGSGEADLQALLTGGEAEPQRDMRLARAARSQSDDVLAAVDEFPPHQLHGQSLFEGGDRLEVEAVEALGGRELRRLDATLDHPPLPLDQLELAEPQQVLDMILALGGALPGKPGVLALEGGQLELPEMMLEQDLRRVAHRAVPEIRLM